MSQQEKSGQVSTPTTVQNATRPWKCNGQLQHNHQLQEHHEKHAHNALCLTLLSSKLQTNPLQDQTTLFNPPIWPSGITTLEELCNAWSLFTEDERGQMLSDIGSLLNQIHVDSAIGRKIFSCLLGSVG